MIHSSENQRVVEALKFLKNSKSIKNDLEFLDTTGFKQGRLSYLKSENGGTLTSEELEILENNYPQINWTQWVKLGRESMLKSSTGDSENIVNEPTPNYSQANIDESLKDLTVIYKRYPELQKTISKIILGESELTQEEQLLIARKEMIRLIQKIVALVNL